MNSDRDRRRANVRWVVDQNDGSVFRDGAQLAVLQDIRDELQKLNTVFRCDNFLSLPLLKRIARNTVKPRKRAKKVAR